MKLCSVEGCEARHNCRGFCKKHYTRYLRHGDPGAVAAMHGQESPLTEKAARSPTAKDLAWAAGFLEGEGNFRFNRGSPQVRASQKEREPLDRLLEIFGGRILRDKHPQGPYWFWSASGSRGRGIMMTLYSLMSLRRQQQIRWALGIEGRAAA